MNDNCEPFIFGVCCKLSHSYNIDITLLRILFILSLFLIDFGITIIIYIIMAFILNNEGNINK